MTSLQRFIGAAFAVGLLFCFANRVLYGGKPLLSGDQSTQVIAAESLLAGDGLLVPLDAPKSQSGLKRNNDYRETLCWFPPGYSVLIASLTWVGVRTADAAAILFYANAVLSCVLWLLVARKYRIPIRYFLVVFAFQVVSYLPCTTTDQFLWPVAATMFLLFPADGIRSLAGLSIVFCLAVCIRWFAVIFPVIWLAWTYLFSGPGGWRSTKTHVRALTPLGSTALFYLALVYSVAGSFQPYEAHPPVQIHWLLLFKGFYFALLGGVSSVWKPMQAATTTLAILVCIGLWPALEPLLMGRKNASGNESRKVIPQWGAMVLLFQTVIVCFLITTQLFKGSMYDPEVPAFATARLYFICQPLSLALVFWLLSTAPAGFGFHRILPVFATAVIAGSAGTYWAANQRALSRELLCNGRGFLFPKEYVVLESELKRLQPDLVIHSDCGPQITTVFDPKRLVPDAMARFDSNRPLKVVQVKNARVVSVDEVSKLAISPGRQ